MPLQKFTPPPATHIGFQKKTPSRYNTRYATTVMPSCNKLHVNNILQLFYSTRQENTQRRVCRCQDVKPPKIVYYGTILPTRDRCECTPWGDRLLFRYPSRYPAAGNELVENRWSTKLCSLSVLKQLFFFPFVRIYVRLGSKCRVKWSPVCHTEGIWQLITTLSVCVQWSLQDHPLSKF